MQQTHSSTHKLAVEAEQEHNVRNRGCWSGNEGSGCKRCVRSPKNRRCCLGLVEHLREPVRGLQAANIADRRSDLRCPGSDDRIRVAAASHDRDLPTIDAPGRKLMHHLPAGPSVAAQPHPATPSRWSPGFEASCPRQIAPQTAASQQYRTGEKWTDNVFKPATAWGIRDSKLSILAEIPPHPGTNALTASGLGATSRTGALRLRKLAKNRSCKPILPVAGTTRRMDAMTARCDSDVLCGVLCSVYVTGRA